MGIEFVRPWRPVSDSKEGTALQRRLEFEVTRLHPLWDRQARIVGRSDANDDVVVAMSGGGFAIVHLVWGETPGDAVWPATYFFTSEDEISRAMSEWSRDAGFLDED